MKLRILSLIAFYLVAFFVLFMVVAGVLMMYPKLELHMMLNACHTGFLDVFFTYYSMLAEGALYVLALLPLLWKRKELTIFYAVSEVTAGLVSQILKHVFSADRPVVAFEQCQNMVLPVVEGVHLHHSNSFPSGHASTFFVFFTCCASFLSYRYLQCGGGDSRGRRLLFNMTLLVLLALAALGGYSRVYLSQHFLSDVCAGSFIGVMTPCLLLWFAGNRLLKLNKT